MEKQGQCCDGDWFAVGSYHLEDLVAIEGRRAPHLTWTLGVGPSYLAPPCRLPRSGRDGGVVDTVRPLQRQPELEEVDQLRHRADLTHRRGAA